VEGWACCFEEDLLSLDQQCTEAESESSRATF
jgi:hypothetical protein